MKLPTKLPTTARLAPFADAACIVVFVVAGRRSHGIDQGADWFLTVAWPFLVGWFTVAVATRLYTRPADRRAHVATLIAGVVLAMVLRAAFTSRDVEGAFVIVATLFLAATTFGWRAALNAISRRRAG